MLVMRLTARDGKPVYFFGLTAENIRELQNGRPIYKSSGAEFPCPFHAAIFYGDTDQALMANIAESFRAQNVPVPDMLAEAMSQAASRMRGARRDRDPDPTAH